MYRKQNHGFSLLELSIVLFIAGILMAAITSGLHLLQASRLNKIISEINGYVIATNNFKDKYKALPGDMPNATAYWGVYPTNPDGTANGDGNERIEGITTESLGAWQQMALAGIIAGKYTGQSAGAITFVTKTNVPGSLMDGAYYFLNYQTDVSGTSGNALQLGSSDTNTSPFGGALTPSDAHIIDTKIDDGIASTGNVYSIKGNNYSGDACITSSSADYILSDIAISCRMLYWLNKQ